MLCVPVFWGYEELFGGPFTGPRFAGDQTVTEGSLPLSPVQKHTDLILPIKLSFLALLWLFLLQIFVPTLPSAKGRVLSVGAPVQIGHLERGEERSLCECPVKFTDV